MQQATTQQPIASQFKLTFHGYWKNVPDNEKVVTEAQAVEAGKNYEVQPERIKNLKRFDKTGSYYLTIERIK